MPTKTKGNKKGKKRRKGKKAHVNMFHMKTYYNLNGPDMHAKISAAPPNLLQEKREILQQKLPVEKQDKNLN